MAEPTPRTCNSASFQDVNATINGLVDSVGHDWSPKAPHGTKITIPADTPAAWTQPITVGRNLTIVGAGLNTVIKGGAIWILNPLNNVVGSATTDTHQMRLSGMHLIRTVGGVPIKVIGTSVIDVANISTPTLSGGTRVDHILIEAATAALESGTHTMEFQGWIEGLVDHVVVNMPAGTGEHIIVNHNTNPNGTGGSGEYAWSNALPLGGPSTLIFEDCIIRRHGGIDTNQNGTGAAGGAHYVARHCSSIGSLGSGHGTREQTPRLLGMRKTESYKNLFFLMDNPNSGSNLEDFRGGEGVIWGNRFNDFTWTSASAAATPFQVQVGGPGSWVDGSAFGGADGTNLWDVNQKGSFVVNSVTFNPADVTFSYVASSNLDGKTGNVSHGQDSNASRGDIYAMGTGGSRDSNVAPGNKKVHLNNLDYGTAANKWKGFVIRLTNGAANQGNATPVNYAYITASSINPTSLTVTQSNSATVKQGINDAAAQFAIGATDTWEIRRVKQHFAFPGKTMMDTSIDPNSFGTYPNTKLINNGAPRWLNPTEKGATMWDNAYRFGTAASPGAWVPITAWTGDVTFASAIADKDGNDIFRAGVVHPGYSYDATVTAGAGHPQTLVGADNEAWALAPASFTSAYAPGDIASVYQAGSGGYDYPHGFIKTTFAITCAQSATFQAGTSFDCAATPKKNCFLITTANATGAVVLGQGGWTPALSNITLVDNGDGTAYLRGTVSGQAAGKYTTTLTAHDAVPNLDTLDFELTVQDPIGSPTITLDQPTGGPFTAPATIKITASSVTAPGSTVKSVGFYQAVGLATPALINSLVTSGSYETTWTSVAAGTYTLTAIVTNAVDTAVTSSSKSVTVGQAPTALPAPNISVSA